MLGDIPLHAYVQRQWLEDVVHVGGGIGNEELLKLKNFRWHFKILLGGIENFLGGYKIL